MKSEERRRLMRLLASAKDGDEQACNHLVSGLADHFAYMIRSFNSVDPAFDMDDLVLQFQLGIWGAITIVDERGDPLYHLAWRGRMAVASMLQVIKRRRRGTEQWVRDFGEERSVGTLPEGWDPPDQRPENHPDYELGIEADRQEARIYVDYLLEHAPLSERQQEVVLFLMTDPDAGGDGANLRLANKLGVSPQMASKHRRAVVEMLSGRPTPIQLFACQFCLNQFKSKGALTQHLRGQSGHRACEAIPSSN